VGLGDAILSGMTNEKNKQADEAGAILAVAAARRLANERAYADDRRAKRILVSIRDRKLV